MTKTSTKKTSAPVVEKDKDKKKKKKQKKVVEEVIQEQQQVAKQPKQKQKKSSSSSSKKSTNKQKKASAGAPPGIQKKDRNLLTTAQLKMGKRRVGINVTKPGTSSALDEKLKQAAREAAAISFYFNIANKRTQVTSQARAKAYQMAGYGKIV